MHLLLAVLIAFSIVTIHGSPLPDPEPSVSDVHSSSFSSPSISSISVSSTSTSASADSAPPTPSSSPSSSSPGPTGVPIFGGKNLADSDRSRVVNIINEAHKSPGKKRQIPSTNDNSNFRRAPVVAPVTLENIGTTYTARVSVGSPSKVFTLLVDTGSANTWIGARGGHSVKEEKKKFSVSYGSGEVEGNEFTDNFSFTPSLSISAQSLGSATRTEGFPPNIDGILGLGPTELTTNTVQGREQVPTVMDNLYNEGTISKRVFGIGFKPVTISEGTGKGVGISFGEVDNEAFNGDISYASIPDSGPASAFWGLHASFSYKDQPIQSRQSGILDTGTTLVLLSTSSFKTYATSVGAEPDENTGLLRISRENYNKMDSLWIDLGDGKRFEFTKDAQRWPAKLNTAIGGKPDDIYLVISDLGSDSLGVDFVLGYTFLERFYSVYDADKNRVGLASTQYSDSVVNN